MRLGIIADIHGNDVALRAVLKDADRLGVDRWWALGDLFRALNPGSAGLPPTCGIASWLLLEDDRGGLAIGHRRASFDVEAVVSDLRRRRHPNAEFTASILTGQRQQIRARL